MSQLLYNKASFFLLRHESPVQSAARAGNQEALKLLIENGKETFLNSDSRKSLVSHSAAVMFNVFGGGMA